MESLTNWVHHGPGRLELSSERAKQGARALRLASPTKTEKPPPVVGRPFAESVARRTFAGENWTAFNRLSFWVHPTLPGFKVISMLVKLRNEGTVAVPDRYHREGLHFFLLKPDQWNHVVWEIAHLARDRVTGVEIVYRLQGNEPGATTTVQFDLDHLELQRVVPDPFEGWEVAPGRIAYSHTGYLVDSQKTALASGVRTDQFEVRDVNGGRVVLRRQLWKASTDRPIPVWPASATGPAPPAIAVPPIQADIAILDFSELRQPGLYQLRVGDLETRPFQILDAVWKVWAWKTVNLFFCERCGFAVPGIHDVCHQDWRATHAGASIVINGGWHDAGDLSQGLVNTAEATYAMLALADATNPLDPLLSRRLLEEARWGLEWILKTRFEDGSRVSWATMDFWTDGVLGNADDTLGDVRRSAYDSSVAASAEALGARLFRTSDPAFAERCLEFARRDWETAVARLEKPNLDLASVAALAAIELFRATGQSACAEQAVRLADVIVRSQQQTWTSWQVPLCGFYYTGTDRRQIQHYAHRGHEQAPTVALSALCQTLPDHGDWMNWYAAVVLHSDYLARIAQYTQPYAMLPASVYPLAESQDATFRAQVRNGIALGDDHFLRLFPVWFDFRGNSGTTLSQAKALSAAAQLRGKPELLELALRQFEWHLGRNPFAQSLMFGEGHDYAAQYTAMSGDMVGSLPVGVQTREDFDQPYWPPANCYNYKEVWVHPSSRWLWITEDVARQQSERARPVENKPGTLILSHDHGPDGRVLLRAKFDQDPKARLILRAFNLETTPTPVAPDSATGQANAEWSGRVLNPGMPWIAVVTREDDPTKRAEVGNSQPPNRETPGR